MTCQIDFVGVGTCAPVGDLLLARLHQPLAVGPKMHELIPKRISRLDFPLGIELRVERILDGPFADPGEERGLVVAGVRADVPP